ncbi:MAG: Uncharacterized protein XD50_1294 [Clostridia bacterium 41_269]|nr:MAG: Uncharacterized protein XD50_1294 [Clostridia bacterium 41_269]
MQHINQLELQNLRHLIFNEMVCSSKCSAYAEACNHPQLKDFFQKGAQEAKSNVEKLKQFLH